jgi:hypothetical protein
MHWRTYHRLIDEMHEAETRSDLLMLERFAQPID